MSWKFIFLNCLIHYASSEENIFPETDIIGGTEVTDRTAFPYQVSLRYKMEHYCGGTIIDHQHILTAAHCCFRSKNVKFSPEKIVVYAGDLQLNMKTDHTQFNSVKNIFTHPDYHWESFTHDIAILRLENHLNLNDFVKPLKLSQSLPLPGTSCVLSGWTTYDHGSTQLSKSLQYIEVSIVDAVKCSQLFGPRIIKGMFCGGNLQGNAVSAHGASGGPLTCDSNTIVGIFSWNTISSERGIPEVYTDVSVYVDWIEAEKLRSDSNKQFSSIFIIAIMFIFNFVYL